MNVFASFPIVLTTVERDVRPPLRVCRRGRRRGRGGSLVGWSPPLAPSLLSAIVDTGLIVSQMNALMNPHYITRHGSKQSDGLAPPLRALPGEGEGVLYDKANISPRSVGRGSGRLSPKVVSALVQRIERL